MGLASSAAGKRRGRVPLLKRKRRRGLGHFLEREGERKLSFLLVRHERRGIGPFQELEGRKERRGLGPLLVW